MPTPSRAPLPRLCPLTYPCALGLLSRPRRLCRLCELRKLLKIQVFLFVIRFSLLAFRFSLFVLRLAFVEVFINRKCLARGELRDGKA